MYQLSQNAPRVFFTLRGTCSSCLVPCCTGGIHIPPPNPTHTPSTPQLRSPNNNYPQPTMATTAPPGASVAAQAAPTSGSPSPRVITQEGVTELVKLLNENRTRGDVEKTAVHIGDDEGKEDDTQMYFDVPAEVATALNKVVSPEYLVRSYRL